MKSRLRTGVAEVAVLTNSSQRILPSCREGLVVFFVFFFLLCISKSKVEWFTFHQLLIIITKRTTRITSCFSVVDHLNIMNKIGGMYRLQSKQWLAALAATLTMINVGNEVFWVMRAQKNLTNSYTFSRETKDFVWDGFFVAAISSMVGAILGAILAEKFGRRRALLVTSFFAITQIVSSFTTNCVLTYAALILGEIGIGMTRVVVPLYVSEIAENDIRGALLMLQVPLFYVGKFIGVVGIGELVSAEIVGVISSVLTGIFLVTFTRLPETPYYLASKNRNEAATKSLAFYRGVGSPSAENGIDEIIKNDSQGWCGKIKELMRPTNRKGLLIIIFFIIVKWSGIILNTQCDLLHVVVKSLVSRVYHGQIIVYLTSMIASFLIVFTIDVIGRRSLLSFSTLLCSILVIITLVFNIIGNCIFEWVFALALYFSKQIIFSVPLVYIGELFSPNVKALAIAILAVFNILTRFLIISLPEVLAVDAKSLDVNRSLIGSVMLLVALPITFAFIPETKRKSFSDIQSKLATTFHCRWLIEKLSRTEPSE